MERETNNECSERAVYKDVMVSVFRIEPERKERKRITKKDPEWKVRVDGRKGLAPSRLLKSPPNPTLHFKAGRGSQPVLFPQ